MPRFLAPFWMQMTAAHPRPTAMAPIFSRTVSTDAATNTVEVDDLNACGASFASGRGPDRFYALDMARGEAGALKLKIEAIDLSDAVTGAAHDARRALEGHAVRLDVPPDLPLVRADPQLLHHCLLNLLDNAGRYGDPGTEIVIEGRHRHGSLRLSVLDHGPGLPPGREAEVFETFRRLEGSDRVAGGTGLGLAIVKAFAEAMGLTVEAGNREDGAGAAFALCFPRELIMRDGAPEGMA